MTQVLKTSDHLGNLRVNGRIVFENVFTKMACEGVDWIGQAV